MRYFAKYDLNILPPGLTPDKFERLLPGYGHIATEDPAILAIIDGLKGRGGFTEITKADWDETLVLQKKISQQTPPKPSDPRNALPQLQPSAANLERVIAAGTNAPVPTSPAPEPVAAPAPGVPTEPQVPVESSPTVRKGPLLRKTP